MEQSVKVNVFKTEYICDSCGICSMIPNGLIKFSNPPLYSHICDNCGQVRDLRKTYPLYEYEGDK